MADTMPTPVIPFDGLGASADVSLDEADRIERARLLGPVTARFGALPHPIGDVVAAAIAFVEVTDTPEGDGPNSFERMSDWTEAAYERLEEAVRALVPAKTVEVCNG